ncbi:hypothetical protein [Rubinisphaera margarita]|uniref:hypothetical protein n=1 Tax=Rubinisphaera margarita TaxID=2909586 RepID=UPI001EE85113|nr:hypothetical protein [Rubinisphaera margarita]MCG6155475.1 hypothetical protein [Rubinisphaera margarita]
MKTPMTLLLFAVTVVTGLTGCSSATGPEMFETSGSVHWEGAPLKEGRITFRMLDGEGRVYSGPITNGAFNIETLPGEMRVEIIASRPIPGKFDHSNGEPAPIGEMYIPAKYNSRSELKYSVGPDAAPPDFNLISDSKT